MLPGDALLDIVRSAKDALVIVAPYIKVATLQKIVDKTLNDCTSLTCLTRWRPEDIATGVCDLEILDVIEKFSGGKLLIHPNLHAKYYRGDGRCLVGSANLTHRGLGWAAPANIELLIKPPYNFDGLKWEERLLEAAIPATQQLKEAIKREAERLLASGTLSRPPEVDQSTDAVQWVPRCPAPERLWDIYSDRGLEMIISTTLEAAQRDLATLAIPSGLTKNLFESYVTSILKQIPLILKIDNLALSGLPDNHARTILQDHLGGVAPNTADQAWRILKSWLIYFLGQTYRLEARHEVLVKGQNISNTDKN